MADVAKWDDVELPDETITDGEYEEAESLGKKPTGRYLCEVISCVPREIKQKAYTVLAANLKFKILEVVELFNKELDTEDRRTSLEGQFIFDSITLEHAQEKDAIKSRRILVAKRLGLIRTAKDKMTKKMWQEDVIGKRAILTFDDREWLDEKTNTTKSTRAVTFNGYEKPENETVAFDDI